MSERKVPAVVSGQSVEAKPHSNIISQTIKTLEDLDETLKWARNTKQALDTEYGEELRHTIESASDYIRDEYLTERDRFDEATAFASESEISRELKILVCCWPNTTKADLATFGMVLVAEVKALQLSVYGLTAGCRKLRTTKNFLPTIAEAIEAFKNCNERIFTMDREHLRLQHSLEGAIKRLAYQDRQEADEKARRRKRQQEERESYERRLADGKSVEFIDFNILNGTDA